MLSIAARGDGRPEIRRSDTSEAKEKTTVSTWTNGILR